MKIKMKIKEAVIAALMICMTFNTGVYAQPQDKYQPTADVYKEGVYNFQSTIGNRLIFKLSDPSKPVSLAMFEDNKLIYFVELSEKFTKAEIILDNPLKTHTAVVVGEGELSFTFE